MRTWRSLPVWILAVPLALLPAARAGEVSGGGTKANLDLPFDAYGDSDDGDSAPDIINFYDQWYEADFFCFTCDRSGSMEGAPWRRLQQEVIRSVSQFSNQVQFAIVFFDTNIARFPLGDSPAEATPDKKAAAIGMVTAAVTGHGSCYKEALLLSLRYANLSSAKRKVIVCLGDGHTTCPGNDAAAYGRETLRLVTGRNVAKVQINTLGIGDVDEAWMRALAAENRGTYHRVQ